MDKLLVFSLLGGDLNQGFPAVTVQLWDNNQPYPVKFTGSLPAAPELYDLYQQWRLLYEAIHQSLGCKRRIKFHRQNVTNVSADEFHNLCKKLQNYINDWLSAITFQNVEQQLRTQLNRDDEIRVIIETNISFLYRIPWHLWKFFEDYPHAEVALSYQKYERPQVLTRSHKGKVRILAVLGNSDGIDIDKDRLILKSLGGAETEFLVEPTRIELDQQLWNHDWDILFFAGHSISSTDSQIGDENGKIYINKTDSLTIPQLKNSLKKAISQGLQLAIFNSCDGTGLARDLAELNLPQIIVMREPVPDLIAQEFLKNFLTAFSIGKPFYSAVREARERLQGWENDFPCASWLPVICQNPTVVPPTWQQLCGNDNPYLDNTKVNNVNKTNRKHSIGKILLSTTLIAASVFGLRYIAVLEQSELQAFDQMLRLRSQDKQDTRILIVEVTEKDIQNYRSPTIGLKSISDNTLALLLNKLQTYKPRVIGVDIYRDVADPLLESNKVELTKEFASDNVITVCKGKDSQHDPEGVAPPKGFNLERLGFSDGLRDPGDGIVRRQILMMEQEPSSPCKTPISLSLQLAGYYLDKEGITHELADDYIRFGSTVFNRLKPGHSGAYQQREGVNLGGMQLLLNYRNADFMKVSLGSILNNSINPDLVKDKIVIIGVTANSTSDTWPTPYSVTKPVYQETPGIFIQAQMTSQIISAVLDKRPIIWVLPDWGDILWIFGWSFAVTLVFWKVSSPLLKVLGIGVTVIILYGLCAALFLAQGLWLPFIPAVVVVVANGFFVLISFNKFN
jgi:CHASE2 domain-containing sensor protein